MIAGGERARAAQRRSRRRARGSRGPAGTARSAARGRENLCTGARFTGLDVDGGYAERTVADARFCLPLPDGYGDVEVAPLLCAGLIGARALRMTGDAERLGLYGFGAAAHIVAQVALHEGRRVFAFTRPSDERGAAFALELGCEWAGDALEPGPEPLDAAIIFAPAGELVPAALRALERGGVVVCAGIHMSDIPSFPYELLWGERCVRSVANLTRERRPRAARAAPQVPVRTHVDDVRARAGRGRARRDPRRAGSRGRRCSCRSVERDGAARRVPLLGRMPVAPRALSDLRAAMRSTRARPRCGRGERDHHRRGRGPTGFTGSPTILVDGRDVAGASGEPVVLACRVYRRRDGRVSPLPDPDDVRDALRARARRRPDDARDRRAGAGLRASRHRRRAALARRARATVVVFTCNHCPYALAWHERLADVARDYAAAACGCSRSTATTPSATRATRSRR